VNNPKKLKVFYVKELPLCDFCSGVSLGVRPNPNADKAIVDAPTRFGSWANMCQRHYDSAGVAGMGSRFEVRS
jgi:hypothetical protein